jgi:hypothetical protein
MDPGKDVFADVKVTADSGFHSKTALAAVEATGADAYIADRDYHRRNPAFAGATRYKARDKKERDLRRKREREARETTEPKQFTVKDFRYDEARARCICPAGHKLYCSGKDMLFNGYRVAKLSYGRRLSSLLLRFGGTVAAATCRTPARQTSTCTT